MSGILLFKAQQEPVLKNSIISKPWLPGSLCTYYLIREKGV